MRNEPTPRRVSPSTVGWWIDCAAVILAAVEAEAVR